MATKFTSMRPFFACQHYDESGKETIIRCGSLDAAGNMPCAVPGVATCTLFYNGMNVASLVPGTLLTLCNTDLLNKPADFYKVAYPELTQHASHAYQGGCRNVYHS
jgi:hypothetical protein